MMGAAHSTSSAVRPGSADIRAPGRKVQRPIHLRPSYLALVFTGGALGTAARAALITAFPAVNGVPYAVFLINVCAAFLLGLLLELLTNRGPDGGRRRAIRLLLGTGLIGGFSTYRTLAAGSAVLIKAGTAGAGFCYALATVVVGAAATWSGIAFARALGRSSEEGRR